MNDYKKMMGYSKKEEIKKKENQVLETIKDEFGFNVDELLNEVGASAEYRKPILKIDKYYNEYWKAVKEFEEILQKKGLKKQAKVLHKEYMTNVLKFKVWFTGWLRRLL